MEDKSQVQEPIAKSEGSEVISKGLSADEIKTSPGKSIENPPDGVDKLMKLFGIDEKHKMLVMIIGMGAAIYFAVNIFSAKDIGLDDVSGDSLTVIKKDAGRVVLIDPSRLIQAAVAQALFSDEKTKATTISPEDLGAMIREEISGYEKAGFVVIDKKYIFAAPGHLDLTTKIAREAGLDLTLADRIQPEARPAAPIAGLETEADSRVGYE